MNKIGFDFGTTNSAISFYNEEKQGLDNFQMDASANDYIPTVIAYKDNDIYIGDQAKKALSKKAFETYEHFKLRLGTDYNKKIEGKNRTPLEITTDYIRTILDKYKQVQNVKSLDGIVMTVPETWFREASNRTARENIEEIYKNLGYEDVFKLESEPVAAAGYFCWSYTHNKECNPKGESFTGDILVVDFGGGTLDVTLCNVDTGNKIKILERCGYGEYNNTNGCAGVAFDEAVVERLIKENKLKIKKGDKEFIKLRAEFEENKITYTDNVTKMMQSYYDDPMIVEGEELFTLYDDEIPVTCEDLAECFEKVNKPYLVDSLEQIKNLFPVHHVNENSQNNFKVLMVGGFSNFYCVEETIREFFGSKSNFRDKRFETSFNLKNRSLAISRGAALIAQKVVTVEHTCTHDIGYTVSFCDEDDHWKEKDIAVIKKGTKISEVQNPIYAKKQVEVTSKLGSFKFFMDDCRADKTGKIRAALDKSISDLFPNVSNSNNSYTIGFSVDKNLIPTLHIKDKYGNQTKTSLNKLLERIAIREKE